MKNKPANIEYWIEEAKWKNPEGELAKERTEEGRLWCLHSRKQSNNNRNS